MNPVPTLVRPTANQGQHVVLSTRQGITTPILNTPYSILYLLPQPLPLSYLAGPQWDVKGCRMKSGLPTTSWAGTSPQPRES